MPLPQQLPLVRGPGRQGEPRPAVGLLPMISNLRESSACWKTAAPIRSGDALGGASSAGAYRSCRRRLDERGAPADPAIARRRDIGALSRTGRRRLSPGGCCLDTGTTGLSGGGHGGLLRPCWFLQDGDFMLEQCSCRTTTARPMLERLCERLERASMLVTFNGSASTRPHSRSIINRSAAA